jgi:hypothetical protein
MDFQQKMRWVRLSAAWSHSRLLSIKTDVRRTTFKFKVVGFTQQLSAFNDASIDRRPSGCCMVES